MTVRLLALLLLCLPGWAVAQDGGAAWPIYETTYVNDYANLLPDDVETRITRSLEVLRDDTGVEATVLTLPTRQGYTPTATMEGFATGLFNHWGIGDASRNDGILIMVLRNDRQMRIELGSGYTSGFNREAQDIIDRVFLPNFRNDNYADGIEDGTDAVIARIARVHAEGGAPPESSSTDPVGIGVGATLGILGVIAAVFAIFWRRIRDRFSRCPQCGERGIHTTRQTLQRATRSRKGHGQKTTDCPHCGYHSTAPFVIPLVTSSSSSGGSFGGGSSSGGGASGSW